MPSTNISLRPKTKTEKWGKHSHKSHTPSTTTTTTTTIIMEFNFMPNKIPNTTNISIRKRKVRGRLGHC